MTRRIDKPNTAADIELQTCLDAKQSFIMVAGAGSGKTTSLVKALAHIGGNFGTNLRRRGQRVACITYTKVATAEILTDVGHDPLFHVSTIHSFLWELIKPFQDDIRNWIKQNIQRKIVELHEHNDKPGTRQNTRDKNEEKITRFENEIEQLHTVQKFTYETSSDYLNGIIGHSDIIKMGPSLIENHELLRKITAQKYPYFFVDESQDTEPEFVGSLKSVDADAGNNFCLGFFGDPMQQIYMTGIGVIVPNNGWSSISKPENFRSAKTVLDTINNIRSLGDTLVQTIGNEEGTIEGTARLFVLPTDDQRDENLQRVRAWMSRENDEPHWESNDPIEGAKTLVIVHKMAAKRLGFGSLYEAFNISKAPEKIKSGFTEGTHWSLKPFLNCILPIIENLNHDNSKIMQLLREYSSRLDEETLKLVENPAEHLSSLKADVEGLSGLFHKDETTVREVLEYIKETNLIKLDGRFRRFLSNPDSDVLGEFELALPVEWLPVEEQSMNAYLDCHASQFFGYRKYLNDESVYSTQHGIKGAEFERVLVVLDDEEGSYNLYSYDKLLGMKDLSPTDMTKIENDEPSVLDRTLRLFYVCCSRALKDLAVVYFIADPEAAITQLIGKGFFPPENIVSIDQLG